jgi:BMFP domain-containing protein YqiC
MTDRRGTNGMIAVLNDLYEENAALKARIAQLEAALEKISSVAPVCACIARRG